MKVLILNFSEDKWEISKKISEFKEKFQEVIFVNPSYRIDLGEEISGFKVNYPHDYISISKIDECYDLSLERLRSISILEAQSHKEYISGTSLRRFYSWNYLLAPYMFLWFRFAALVRLIIEKEKPNKYLVIGTDKDFPWKLSSIDRIVRKFSPDIFQLTEKEGDEVQTSALELRQFENLVLNGFRLSGLGDVLPVQSRDGIVATLANGTFSIVRNDVKESFEFKFEVSTSSDQGDVGIELSYVYGDSSCRVCFGKDLVRVGELGYQLPFRLGGYNIFILRVENNIFSVSHNSEEIFTGVLDNCLTAEPSRLSVNFKNLEPRSPVQLEIKGAEVRKIDNLKREYHLTVIREISNKVEFSKNSNSRANFLESGPLGQSKSFFLPIDKSSSLYLDFKILHHSQLRRGVTLNLILGAKSYRALVSNIGLLDLESGKNIKIKFKDRVKVGLLHFENRVYVACRGRFLELTPDEKNTTSGACFIEIGIPGVRELYLLRSAVNKGRRLNLARKLRDWTKNFIASHVLMKSRTTLLMARRIFSQNQYKLEISSLKISTNKSIERDILAQLERHSQKMTDTSEDISMGKSLSIPHKERKHILLVSSPHQSPWIYSQSLNRWMLVDEYLEGVAEAFNTTSNPHEVFTTIIYTSKFSDEGGQKPTLMKLFPAGYQELYLTDFLIDDKKSDVTNNSRMMLSDFPIIEDAFKRGLFDVDGVSPSENFFTFLEVLNSTEQRARSLYLSYDGIMKNLRPDVVWSGRLDAMPYIFPLAKKYNVLTVASKLGIAEEVIPSYLKHNPDGTLDKAETPDLNFLWGNFTNSYFASFFSDFPNKVFPMGRSRLDTFFHEGRLIDKEAVKKSLGFLPREKIVLFGATIRSTYGKSFNDGDGAVFLGKKAYFSTLKTLVELSNKFNFKILIKPWGGDDIDFISDSIQSIGGDRMVLSINSSDQMHNVEYLSAVDLVVSNISCLLGEATAVKVPVINLAFPEIYYLYGSRRMNAYNKLSYPVQNQEELKNAVSSFFGDSQWGEKVLMNSLLGLKDIFGNLDGNISNRMVDQVLTELNKTKEE